MTLRYCVRANYAAHLFFFKSLHILFSSWKLFRLVYTAPPHPQIPTFSQLPLSEPFCGAPFTCTNCVFFIFGSRIVSSLQHFWFVLFNEKTEIFELFKYKVHINIYFNSKITRFGREGDAIDSDLSGFVFSWQMASHFILEFSFCFPPFFFLTLFSLLITKVETYLNEGIVKNISFPNFHGIFLLFAVRPSFVFVFLFFFFVINLNWKTKKLNDGARIQCEWHIFISIYFFLIRLSFVWIFLSACCHIPCLWISISVQIFLFFFYF